MKTIIRSSIVLAAITLATGAFAAAFTDGNVVIVRFGGDGSRLGCAGANVGCVLTNTGSRIWLDEYQILSDGSGNPTNLNRVQSILMPTNFFGAHSPLIAQSTAFGNGLITRSDDGRFLLLGGYGTTFGQYTNTSIGGRPADEVPRVVGVVGGNGTIDTSTTLTNFDQEFRSATSNNGTNLWVGSSSSIPYAQVGDVLGTQLSGLNTRMIHIYSNQLYLSSLSLPSNKVSRLVYTNDVFTLPTTTNFIGFLDLPGTSNSVAPAQLSPWQFVLFKLNAGGTDDPDTLYAMDGGGSSQAAGAIKFSLVGGSWVNNGSVASGSGNIVGLTGRKRIVGSVTNVDLIMSGGGSTLTGGDAVWMATDATGYNGAPTAIAATQKQISPVQVSYRGISFAPTGTVVLVTGPGRLSVGPIIDLFDNGVSGCQTTLGTQQYSVANLGTAGITWSASCPSNWVTLSPTSGSLLSGGSMTVSASFNVNVNNLPGDTILNGGFTNLTTITFANTASAPNNLGTQDRGVFLVMRSQDILPTSDYLIGGQPGGPFSPSNKVYTVTTGASNITVTVSKTALWLNLVVGTTTSLANSVSFSLAACASTNISCVVSQANAATLVAGDYQDVISFTNATAGILFDTRAAVLSAGGLLFCDDFSTFTQNASIDGQQGWVGTGSGPALQVTNNAVYSSGSNDAEEEPYKNIPVTSNGFEYAAMSIMFTSAPPSTVNPVFGPAYYQGHDKTGFFRDEIAAHGSDLGETQFVFAVRLNNCGPWVFGTTALNYGTTNKVILRSSPLGSSNIVLWVNPPTTEVTNGAEVVVVNTGNYCSDDALGSFVLGGQFANGAVNPSAGYAIFKLCIETSYADAYADLQPVDPFVTWQNAHFSPAQLADPAFSGGNADPLGKGINNTNQFLAGFNPTNSAAYPHIILITNSGPDSVIKYLGSNGDSSPGGSPGPKNNVLDFTTGTATGSYSNNFATTGLTNTLTGGTGNGATTTATDPGGATNKPSRYYRVRVLVP